MEKVDDSIARWEGEGGKPAPEQKRSDIGTRHSTALVDQPRTNELLKEMNKVTLKDVTAHREYITTWPRRDYVGIELISVGAGSSLSHVLKVLGQHRISCVPVLAPNATDAARPGAAHRAAQSSWEWEDDERMMGPMMWGPFHGFVDVANAAMAGVFNGFVDILDIMTYLAECMQRSPDKTEKEVLATTVDQLIDRSHKDAVFPFHQDLPSTAVLAAFAKGVHRVPLYSDAKAITGLCSQYDIICCMNGIFDKGVAHGIGCRSMAQCKELLAVGHWGEDVVVCIPPNSTIRQAIMKMVNSGLTAVAVVDNGELVGTLSASDLALIVPTEGSAPMAAWLDKTVEYFLEEHSARVMKPVFELADATVASVCKTMSDHHVHHVWIVDGLETMHPVGIVTMTDICRVAEGLQWPSWLTGSPAPVQKGQTDIDN